MKSHWFTLHLGLVPIFDYTWFTQDQASVDQVGVQENDFDIRSARIMARGNDLRALEARPALPGGLRVPGLRQRPQPDLELHRRLADVPAREDRRPDRRQDQGVVRLRDGGRRGQPPARRAPDEPVLRVAEHRPALEPHGGRRAHDAGPRRLQRLVHDGPDVGGERHHGRRPRHGPGVDGARPAGASCTWRARSAATAPTRGRSASRAGRSRTSPTTTSTPAASPPRTRTSTASRRCGTRGRSRSRPSTTSPTSTHRRRETRSSGAGT